MAEIISVGFVVSTLVSVLVAAIALIISDRFIAHQIDAKRILIMAVIAMFVAPLVGSFVLGFIAGTGPVAFYVIPLLVWIALGELLLSAEKMTKLKVAVVGFFVYIILSMLLTPYIFAVIPF